MAALIQVSSNRVFGGYQKVFSHESIELGCKMNFGIYLPPMADEKKVPVVYWLSGLTCTEKNFIEKAGAQRYASEHGVAIVGPDTSPRDLNISGEEDSWDFGTGAGFYVDATQEPWNKNYHMFSYITKELPKLINENFPILPNNQSIMGHSMGGHGALICALKNPGQYRSVSAFAPICNPSQCAWGKKAFLGYLGCTDDNKWSDWDATELVKKYQGPPLEILIDQETISPNSGIKNTLTLPRGDSEGWGAVLRRRSERGDPAQPRLQVGVCVHAVAGVFSRPEYWVSGHLNIVKLLHMNYSAP